LLYNFIEAGKVSYYQSGLVYRDDPRLKPGLVAHALTIQRAADAGLREYDLLAGDYRYKRSLATASRDLVWLRLERGNLKTRTIAALRALRELLRSSTLRPQL
jgi:CelD/BcsL family acetyltransferase involved in cellulose biosynthesis